MRLSNHIIGLAAILGAAGIVYGTLGFREIQGQEFGSAFFPRITAGALALTGLALIITSPRSRSFSLPDWAFSSAGLRALALPVAGVAWVFAAPMIGFLLATALMIFVLAVVAGGRPIIALGVALGCSVLLHLIFGVLLRIPLPRGIAEGWLT